MIKNGVLRFLKLFIFIYAIFWEIIQVLQRGVRTLIKERFEKICFTDPLNFVLRPSRFEIAEFGGHEESNGVLTDFTIVIFKLPNCVNGYVTLT